MLPYCSAPVPATSNSFSPQKAGGWLNVLLKLGLAEGRGVGSNEDELGLAGAEGLEGAAVAEDDLAGLDNKGKLERLSA